MVGGWGDVDAGRTDARPVRPHPADIVVAGSRPISWPRILIGVTTLTILLAAVPGRTQIPPLVESDYCYLLTAANRFFEGHGLTATPPVAPFVNWEWRGDWSFLTQWPAGYPLLVAALRKAAGLSTLDACRWIGVVACAFALVGWFAFVRRHVPLGVTGLLLTAVAAGSSLSVGMLTNPSTDVILIAVLPFVLLPACEVGTASPDAGTSKASPQNMLRVGVTGLLAGGLFWMRYASVFVPFAIGLYLLLEWRRRSVGPRCLAVFSIAAAAPIVALLAINKVLGQATSTAATLNLGNETRFDFSLERVAQAWWMFTDLGFYDHHPITHWLYAAWPLTLIVGASVIRPVRSLVKSALSVSAVRIGACLAGSLLGMLVAATTLFGAKFNYVGLDRYYQPVKPLYPVLFLTPLLFIPRRAVRAALSTGLVICGLWIVQQEWVRTYARWAFSDRSATPLGAWSRCFEPGGRELYTWLAARSDPNLVVVSNFHEYIALETNIPAIPIPPNRQALDDWLSRIRVSRGVTVLHVLFVLDPDNKWRNHWIQPPTEIIREFRLELAPFTPQAIAGYIFRQSDDPAITLARTGSLH